MCGRFALGIPRAQVIRIVRNVHPELDINPDRWIDEEAFHPRYNVAPRTRTPVIRRVNKWDDRELFDERTVSQDDESAEDGHVAERQKENNDEKMDLEKGTVLHTMKWGLVPHWSKHEDTTLNTINAKGENLVEGSGMWNSIKGRKRCVIVCQGYYEWQRKGKNRIPYFTKRKDSEIMLLAGLYDSVILEGTKEPLYTYTIVTTDANKQLSFLHDRMPLILATPGQLTAWLDTSTQTWSPKLSKLVRPYTPLDRKYDLVCYPVPVEVGKVGEESSTFIEPVSKRKDGIEAMFAKQTKTRTKTGGDTKAKEESPMALTHRGTSSSFSSSPSSSASKKPNSTSEDKKSTLKRNRSFINVDVKEDRESSIELLEGPPEMKKSRKEDQLTSTSKTKPSLSTKTKLDREEGSTNKITSFFSPEKR